MIQITNLKKYYGKNLIINDVSCKIKAGEIFAIVGHSGAGKSTLLRCINGLESYQSGSLKVDNKEVSNLNENELRELRRNIGMIFQHFALMSRKTVFENIATPLKFWKYDKEYIQKRVHELLELVGLSDKANNYPNSLSGGQKQRVAIARALALKPKILLSDEATSALDPNTTNQILTLLRQINETLGITIVLVTHEMEVVKSISNRAILLEQGIITNQGNIIDLFLKPDENMKKFLGAEEILPTTGVNIRLFFPPKVAFNSVITSMARELNIDFNIVWGKLERLGNNVLGSLVINVDPKDEIKVEEFIKKSGVLYEIVKEQK
ncbi:methionine ABC transporter ATP-binding protein [Campylobacter fetus]|uniref:Cell division ATP-binding protein FtsE n=1 Tax=Campylobacter fetus TaxID=196 RepID=A0A5N7FVY8_CAMFE|nr:methionine ABC transporter ATP-binding protein [Campylobacter fetus]EAI4413971.1 methionine ABC transporter ATP-binding protein [Campylobacter fetus]EAI5407275.1 methionine ABC transporter ATP-binding protein [Campylobacter fetus]EAJ0327601.1 methionine ABC transporter ATP-binding protein [Campylobacter fetus]EAJ1229697.1 methionine ABC transporter ATP-binding protein [Campylobacter fetus]EAK0415179.1 methionine ABC transporter ATP-binding protein [Campylobacter fetus]